ncbi:MAG: YkgJ family cysteine cluster protein [Selenomonadaceae bacterium]|nr:YkgJ family cysteine cluster protein [Selenomonadaceae bacterium]
MEKFNCDACGLCCRHINRSDWLEDFDSGNGVCKYLNTDTNLCKIYDTRPDICSVERAYKKYFSDQYSEEEFLRINYEACEILKREEKLFDKMKEMYERDKNLIQHRSEEL